ncbi:MAG: hypothetical protein IPK88_18615 [Saprospiraceae bacterium]|nr:hypothetical protein [Candidatus Defluviibacterium haderslevense]
MKKIITSLIFLLVTVDGFSKCASFGIYFWPNKKTIHQNSILVMEGFGTSQKIVSGLGTTYIPYLKTGTQKIKLKVQEILVGQYELTQALLKPETNLSVGQEYELTIENLLDFENEVPIINNYTGENESIKWIVIAQQDISAPTWTNGPKFKNSTYEEYGCGPETFVNFTFSANSNSEFLIRTVVKNLSTGKETAYYLPNRDNVIEVGHDMCSGAFVFYDGNKFEVEFCLFNEYGNFTKWQGEKIEFLRPK